MRSRVGGPKGEQLFVISSYKLYTVYNMISFISDMNFAEACLSTIILNNEYESNVLKVYYNESC